MPWPSPCPVTRQAPFTAYLIGRNLGQPFFLWCTKYLRITPERIKQTQSWLDRFGAGFYCFRAFFAWCEQLDPVYGRCKQDWGRLLPFYNTLFTLGWGGPLPAAGHVFRSQLPAYFSYLNSGLLLVGLGLLALYFAYVSSKNKKTDKKYLTCV